MASGRQVVVIGGGVIGCGVAWRLAREGCRVTVLEQGRTARESSWAAGGILGAQVEAHDTGPVFELCLHSRGLFPRFLAQLKTDCGEDVGHVPSGVLRLLTSEQSVREAHATVARHTTRGLRAAVLTTEELQSLEPSLAAQRWGALHFPDDGRLHARRFVHALVQACGARGVTLQEQATVVSVLQEHGRVSGVRLVDGTVVRADAVVLAAGAWSSLLRQGPLPHGTVRPVKGQMLHLRPRNPIPRAVVFAPGGYLVPWEQDGLLAGSTMEEVGFDRNVTPEARAALTAMALALVPGLVESDVADHWAGFRPASGDGRPVVGETALKGLIVATGHFRNGVLLTPVTSEVVAGLVVRGESGLDLSAFTPARFAGADGPLFG